MYGRKKTYLASSTKNLKPALQEPTPQKVQFDNIYDIFSTISYGNPQPHDIRLKESNVQNNHILYNIYNTQYENVNLRMYSLLQYRYCDYIKKRVGIDKDNNRVEIEPILKDVYVYPDFPTPNMGVAAAGTGPGQQAQGQDQQYAPPSIDLVYDDVFQNIPQAPEPIHSAYEFFDPSAKTAEKSIETSLQQPPLTPVKEKEFTPKNTQRINKATKKLHSTNEVIKNYDYLFESTITKAGQYNVSDRSPISISSNQLKCGKPQNYKEKIIKITCGQVTKLVRESYGSIEFSNIIENIDLIEISSFVEIEQRYVDINFKLAREYDVDLNQEALITLENVFPVYLNGHPQVSYEMSLRQYCEENNLIFIRYLSNEGILIFYVKNFDGAPYQFPLE